MTETITISKAELNALIDERVKGLGGDGGTTRVLRRVTERKVEIRLVDGKAVLGFQNRGTENRPTYFYQKPDPRDPKNMVDYVDLVLEGAKTGDVVSVDVSTFRKESTRAQCKIVKTDEKEWVINQGTVKKREVEEYSSIELDFDVPLDVVGKTRLYTVEIPKDFGGPREVTVHENYVNIA